MPPARQSPAQEFCRAVFTIQDQGLEEGVFRGMASVFGTLIDAWVPTRIMQGAFVETLNDTAQKRRVKVLYQHSDFYPIGIPRAMAETADGLEVEAKISKTQLGNDALTLIRDGVITELSIGFDPIEWKMVDEGGNAVRHITKLKLWEFSLVTFGANRDARIMSVHSREDFLSFTERHADDLDIWMLPVISRMRELHEGKVLSSKNLKLVEDAITALSALRDAAKKEDESRPPVFDRSRVAFKRMRELDLALLSSSL